ncbi:MAG: ribonuclease HII [Saprospiraceae bacterium]
MLLPFLHANVLEAGCDEAGRGCLAGPVFAAAVVLPPGFEHPLLNDSKQLTESKRDLLREVIEREALAWAVEAVSAADIDRINILQASIEGMHRAVKALSIKPEWLLIDGNRFRPVLGLGHTCVVGGDARYASIAAASVLAKTHRDAYMADLHNQFPQYGWADNKGYPTQAHRNAIRVHGICEHHRTTFRMQ